MIYVLISLIGIFYIIYAFNNIEKAFWLNYFVLLAFPLGENGNFIKTLVSIFEYLIIVNAFLIFFRSLLKEKNNGNYKLKINFVNFAILLLFIIYSIYLFVGLKKGYNAITDSKQYFLQVLLYYSAYKLLTKQSINKFFKITIYALSINSIITLIFYLFRNISFLGVVLDESGRFSYGYESLFIVSIPYLIYLIKKEEQKVKMKIFALISIVLQCILLLLSQNRTNPVLIVLGILFIYIMNLKRGIVAKKNVFFKKVFINIFIIIITIVTSMLFLNYLISINSPIIQRYADILNRTNSYMNYQGRIVTSQYYIDLIIQKPLGYGLGILMPLLTLEYNFYQLDGLNIDQAFITFAYKFGIPNLILYILVFILIYYKIIKTYMNNRDLNYMYLSIFMPLLILATGFFTSQMLHNVSVFAFIWISMGMINKVYKENYN